MKKGKNVKVKTTEEDLRMKLCRFKQEIREMGERKIEVELTTAAAQAKSAARDAELTAKMERYAIMNEETIAMRKEHDVFNNDITTSLQKIRGKCTFFNQEANSGPEDTYPVTTEEGTDKEIVYMPPFLGRLKGGDKTITLPAYERTHSVWGSRPLLEKMTKQLIQPVGIEIWKPSPYHDAINHNIGRRLGVCYDVEFLINMGKIQVEFPPVVNAAVRRRNFDEGTIYPL
uniref:Uncharacterized protein n=1 Tax=Solanum tuberosum TaxID=4113 RepID=M1DNQ5_SOLTU